MRCNIGALIFTYSIVQTNIASVAAQQKGILERNRFANGSSNQLTRNRKLKSGKGGTCRFDQDTQAAKLSKMILSNACPVAYDGITCLLSGGYALWAYNVDGDYSGEPNCCDACDFDLNDVVKECTRVPSGGPPGTGAGGCADGNFGSGIAVVVQGKRTSPSGQKEAYCCEDPSLP